MSSFFTDQFAESIFNSKYAGTSTSITAHFKRLAKLISLGDVSLESKFFQLMISRRFSPGGRILAYAGRPDAKTSLMNCTTHAISNDSLESISTAIHTVMRASSRGQGIGIDLSKLRPNGAPVDNAARTSTGAISFMELINHVGGTIGQEGRRGALLFSLDISHPDIYRPDDTTTRCTKCGGIGCNNCVDGYLPYDFLHVKKIPGKVENANISVKVTDDFMEAVKKDKQWALRFKGDTGRDKFIVSREVPARELFAVLAKSAHSSAEPGVLYWDTSKRMSNSDLFGERWGIQGVNACSEEILDQDGVCNLGSMNLAAYVHNPFTDVAWFDFDRFYEDVGVAVEFLDNVVTVELERGYYVSQQQRESLEFLRRLGLGVMGLADALAMMGLVYGNSLGTSAFLHSLFRTMRNAAYEMSVSLARTKGACKVWKDAEDYHRAVIMGGFFQTLPGWVQADILKHGTRNITVLSIAPTGSISNLFGVSSGIEPLFALSYTRMTRIHGFDEFIDYTHPGVALSRSAGLPDSIWPTAYQVSPAEHLEVQAIIQQYVDASIAKTVNLPWHLSVNDVADVYMTGWSLGLKGLSVYRDGSRTSQVLFASTSSESEKCEQCGGEVVRKEGCTECPTCGWSKCSL